MFDLMQRGGPLMWLLLLCSIIALGVFLERVLYLHRATIDVGELLRGLRSVLQKNHYAEALQECQSTPGPVARVISVAVRNHRLPLSELRELTREAGQLEVPRLERNLGILATLAYVAPLIGLLGTVGGLLQVFLVISQDSGYTTAADVSAGIYQSLLTTGAGMAVAIPAYVGFNFLSGKVNDLLRDMERGGIEIIHLLKAPEDPSLEENP